ncbi:MAG: hypothetical protein IJ856_00835 [Candidatus Methanomethylophilaceae archaeon]|nr:hypothetical protein [Candidatus Methanomethylophilaceae archaeon]
MILTDWDTRGDDLADRLRTNLSSLGVPYDDSFRERMARLCRPYCMDVESLHTVAARLISPLK